MRAAAARSTHLRHPDDAVLQTSAPARLSNTQVERPKIVLSVAVVVVVIVIVIVRLRPRLRQRQRTRLWRFTCASGRVLVLGFGAFGVKAELHGLVGVGCGNLRRQAAGHQLGNPHILAEGFVEPDLVILGRACGSRPRPGPGSPVPRRPSPAACRRCGPWPGRRRARAGTARS